MSNARKERAMRLVTGTTGQRLVVGVIVSLIILGVGTVLGPRLGLTGLAQHQHGRVREMPGVVRGTAKPAAIPNEIAYSMLFRLLARGDASMPARYRQNAAYVRFRMGIAGGQCMD